MLSSQNNHYVQLALWHLLLKDASRQNSCISSCRCADDKPFVPTYQVSKEKAKSLGIDYIPLEQSLKETVESLKEKGFASI